MFFRIIRKSAPTYTLQMELHCSSDLYKALVDVTMIVIGKEGKRVYNSQHFSHCNHWIDNLIGQSAE
jgi:hypothetical protein